MARSETTVIQQDDMPDNESKAVLAYRVGQLEKNQTERFDKLEEKIDAITQGFVTVEKLNDSQKAADSKHSEQDMRIQKLEDWITWAQRIVIGTVITAILGLILKSTHTF